MTTKNPLLNLKDSVEQFLDLWVQNMAAAGYLEQTTAKREDCIRSYWGFLDPVLKYLEAHQELPSYQSMLQNKEGWADNLIQFARRHRERGIGVDMFQGCFKTLIHSLEQMIQEMDISANEKIEAARMIRRWSDGAEILMLADWKTMGQLEAVDRLAESNRKLTLEKNKYENILEATSDMVLVTDPEGMITEVNTEARVVLQQRDMLGRFFGEVLAVGKPPIDTLLEQYKTDQNHEIHLSHSSSVFNLRIIPLQTVSLASRGYMIVLSDISLLVKQRENLKEEVNQRTTELADSEKQYTSLFQNAGESILLVDERLKIIESNRRATRVFGIQQEMMVGLPFASLCSDLLPERLADIIRNLKMDQNWEGELSGKRNDGQIFPMSVTINRVELETASVIQILAKDITRQKELENSLQHEKSRLEELNITLRNVLQSINEKNTEYQQEIIQSVQDVVIPALDKIGKESDSQIRDSYVKMVKDQLLKMTGGSGSENNTALLKLSPTELKICHFIQAGNGSKDIAEALGLSTDTIQTHRKNIRKKLGLVGRDVSLFNYLNAPDHFYPTPYPETSEIS